MKNFKKGDKVRNIYTGEVFIVKRDGYFQRYDGQDDYTVEFEATATQPTPWNKASNLEIV